MLVDTHCHLGDPAFDTDRAAVVRRAAEADVLHIVIVADSLRATDRARALAGTFELSATAGVHPHEASTWSPAVATSIADALDDPAVIAVGETGLDYHYDHSPRRAQRAAFEAQFALAAERRMPIVVHARDADQDMATMLRAWGDRVPAVVLHSFSSGPAVFDAGMDVGAYFGWSGMVTFKNWQHGARVSACPPERLLVETDAPYLAPAPHRGKRNEPAYARHIAEHIAAARGLSLEELSDLSTVNATRCFGGRVTQGTPRHHERSNYT